MFLDKTFRIALLVSLIAHGAILLQNPNFVLFPASKHTPDTEVSYLKNPQELQKASPIRTLTREPFLKTSAKITVDKRTPPPFVDKDKLFSKTRAIHSRQGLFTKPLLFKPDIIAIKRKISLPAVDLPVDLDKINSPTYIGYYQIVREKIRRAAYQNYSRTDTGEVYLSFVLSTDGYLKEVRLHEEKSSSSAYLREIALKSINDASPFPNFPKELDYPQLSFNVVISFELE